MKPRSAMKSQAGSIGSGRIPRRASTWPGFSFRPERRIATDLILPWMTDAGMAAHLDAIGNVCG
jgi:hypothetical protein